MHAGTPKPGALTPAEEARRKAYEAMTPELRDVAQECERQIAKTAGSVIMLQYQIGARVLAVANDEQTYGPNAVQQLADYLGVRGGASYLYSLMNFARVFEADYVRTRSLRPMANGEHVTVSHWLQLMKIEDPQSRERMLERVYREALSANDLEREIRAGVAGPTRHTRQGGRRPKVPTNPVVGLQSVCEAANRLVRFEEAAEKAVFDALDEIAPDRVTDALLARAEQALAAVREAGRKAEEMGRRLEDNVRRLRNVLTARRTVRPGGEGEGEEEDRGGGG